MTDKDIAKIKVFGSDEDSLKTLGQLLSNETSRKIISCLGVNEMYINQISKACGIQMNLTIHHVKKLEEVGLVSVVEKPIIRKGINHKFYKMIPNIFVNNTISKEDMQKNGFLKKFFKEGVKFAVVGFVTIFTWIFTEMNDKFAERDGISDLPVVYDETVGVNTTKRISENISEPLLETTVNYDPLIPIIVLSCGLFLIYFTKKYK